ncbi:hypothetical protein [Streptomyces microflavus]|uniref:hypothetical protein n=1 Tax=Streptomyces microflavus TaxID=1919 RepID=UPI0037FDEBFE
MADDSLVDRIATLPTSCRHGPEVPPSGLDLSVEWHFTFGVIELVSYNEDAHVRNWARMNADLFVSKQDIEKESTITAMSCAACGETNGLALRGKWGEVPDLLCACGNRSPLRRAEAEARTPDQNQRWAVNAMMHAIVRAIREQGLPRPSDPRIIG